MSEAEETPLAPSPATLRIPHGGPAELVFSVTYRKPLTAEEKAQNKAAEKK